MGIRAKSFWVPQLIGSVGLVLWLISALFGLPPVIGWAFFGIAGSIAIWAYVHRLRCPNCGVRFSDRLFRMYRVGPLFLGWAQRFCWNCGVDISEVERAKTKLQAELKVKTP